MGIDRDRDSTPAILNFAATPFLLTNDLTRIAFLSNLDG